MRGFQDPAFKTSEIQNSDRHVKYLTNRLDKFKVPEKEKGELLTIALSLKADIVEEP